MTAQADHEDDVATSIEELLRRDFGRVLGPRTKQDRPPPGLRVDFTYDSAEPAVALEITAIDDELQRRAAAAAFQAKERLTTIVRNEGLGSWAVAFDATASLKILLSEVETLIRLWSSKSPTKGAFLRPGQYGADDLMQFTWERQRREFIAEHERMRRLGLVELHFVGPDESRVEFLAQSEMFVVEHGLDAVAQALEDNSAKLGEARPRETHLAVHVRRPEMSSDLSEADTLQLPGEVDVLWLMYIWHRRPDNSRQVWSLTRGSDTWRSHDDPRAVGE